jgi:hypothetical protein
MKDWFSRNRIELILFALLFGTYAYFYQSTQHNEASRFDQMRAIVEKRTLEINEFWWNTADVIHYSRDGTDHIYPNKAPGMTLLGLGPFVAVSSVVSILERFGFPTWAYWHTVAYLTTLLAVGLLSSLAGVAIYRVVKDITGQEYLPAMAVVAIWLGTLAFPYSTLFFSHQFAASLLALAFFLLFRLRRREGASFRWQIGSLAAAGLLMSFSVISEYPTVLLASLLFGYATWVCWWRAGSGRTRGLLIGACLTGVVIGAVTLLLYNYAAFGKPFYIPYESYSKAGASFSNTYSKGWLGMHWNGMPLFRHALATITIYPQIGMLYLGIKGWQIYACNPVLWLCLPGMLIMLWKRAVRAEGLLVVAMTAIYLIFVTNYGSSAYDWAGASYLGSRHLVPLLPFLTLPLCFGARILRPIFYPLLAISIFYMLIGTATEPRVAIPYENTARDLLIPNYLRARFAQCTDALFDGQRNLAKDSAAFNLGKLAGLPGHYQLVPLLVWWALAGSTLLIVTRKPRIRVEPESTPEMSDPGPGPAPAPSPPTPRRAYPRTGLAMIALFVILVSLPPIIHHSAAASSYKEHGLLGKYYRNANLSGTPADVQVDSEINFDWTKSVPLPPPFSIEWSGSIAITIPRNYTFALVADDYALLEIDGKTVVDATKGPILEKKMGTTYLEPGLHRIRILYYNPLFGGLIRFSWLGSSSVEEIVPQEVLIPAMQSATK